MAWCEACDFELKFAIELQDYWGMQYGSVKGEGITKKTHFNMCMVDDQGNVKVQ